MDVARAKEVLELPEDPEDSKDYRDRVKVAYRAAAKRCHPDRNPGVDTTAQFVEAQQAYERLVRASRGEDDEAIEAEEGAEDADADADAEMDLLLNLVMGLAARLRESERQTEKLQRRVAAMEQRERERLARERPGRGAEPVSPVRVRTRNVRSGLHWNAPGEDGIEPVLNAAFGRGR